jgi:hypothetical protein
MKSFAELTGKAKAIELARWICVPAAAVLGSVVPRIIAGFVMPRAMAMPPGVSRSLDSDFRRFILSRIFEVLVAVAFVVAGAIVAPRWRHAVAIVLAALWILYSFGAHVWVHIGRGIPNYSDFAVTAVAATCGAAYIFYREKSKKAGANGQSVS